MAAGATGSVRVVTGVGESKIDTQRETSFDNLPLCQIDERGVDAEAVSFDSSFGGEVGELLERLDVFRATIRISAVIDGVDADENVIGFQHLGVSQRDCKHDGVASRHVRDWNVVQFGLAAILWDFNVSSQSGTADCSEIDRNDLVFLGAEIARDSLGGFDFDRVALRIADG